MKKNEWVIILTITFGVIMTWVIFDILHTRASVQVSSEVKQILDPVDPVFDNSVIEKIKNVEKLEFDPAIIPSPSSTPIASSSAIPSLSPQPDIPTPTASPTPSPSTSPSPSPSASVIPSNTPNPNIFVAP